MPITKHGDAWLGPLRAASEHGGFQRCHIANRCEHADSASRTTANELLSLAKDAALETAWPTRCAICDKPGLLLCQECRKTLPYIDRWSACPRCGAPHGLVQCTECNETVLEHVGRTRYPFESCAQVVTLDERTGRIILTYKDFGEQRLAQTMAALMAYALPHDWRLSLDFVSFIPSSEQAYRKRGFDHMQQLSWWFAKYVRIKHQSLFLRPEKKDQRELSRKERFRNMANSFQLKNKAAPDQKAILLIDDVFTSGATLSAASDALLEAGAQSVRCLTFARAW